MENKNEIYDSEQELLPFDPIVVVQDVLRRWLCILLAALIAGTAGYIYFDRSYEPVYQTSATFVVTSRAVGASVYTNLTATSNLATVFTDILNSSLLRKEILQHLDGASFDGSITAAAVSETNLLTVTVKASDPETAFLVIRALIDHHDRLTYQVVDNISLEVLQNPVVPTYPINAANASGQARKVALLAAVAMAALLAMISVRRDVVRGSREAEKKLECRFLGEIPHERKYKTLATALRRRKTSILITNPSTGMRYVEAMRKLRRRVERRMQGGRILMVTSLLENEGKSTVAANLALAMAQKHQRVLLIDCDLRKPACHAVLEQRDFAHGLLDVLDGTVTCADALVRDGKSGLYMLLERRHLSESGERLTSQPMQILLEQVRRDFDLVVLDMPPMAGASDTEAVMDLADASLLVVRQNVAPAPALNKAVRVLNRSRAKMVGCVLNNVYGAELFSGRGYGYGKYGRYGGYGYYGSANKE